MLARAHIDRLTRRERRQKVIPSGERRRPARAEIDKDTKQERKRC